jgi:hypothetical protein
VLVVVRLVFGLRRRPSIHLDLDVSHSILPNRPDRGLVSTQLLKITPWFFAFFDPDVPLSIGDVQTPSSKPGPGKRRPWLPKKTCGAAHGGQLLALTTQ